MGEKLEKPERIKEKVEEEEDWKATALRSQRLADFICTEIIDGKSLRTICKEHPNIRLSSIVEWLREDSEFARQYARAKEDQADTMAEDIIQISDDAENIDKSNPSLASAMVQAARLRVDARKWVAAKLKPKKYGDRVLNEVQVAYEDRLKKRAEGKDPSLLSKAKSLLEGKK